MTDMLHRQIATLREQVDERDETIRQLREMLAETAPLPEWMPHLSNTEEALLRLLWRRERVHTAALLMLIGESESLGRPDNKLKVYICKLRRKLGPIGINIVCDWGHGYHLDSASRERLSGALAA